MVGRICLNKYDFELGLIAGLNKNNELCVQVHCLFIGRYNYRVSLGRVLIFLCVLLAASKYYPLCITTFNINLSVSRSLTCNFGEERLRRVFLNEN